MVSFNEFSKQTKEEWLSKVRTDLKGKPLDSLHWEAFNSSFTPFYHSEDLKEKYAPVTSNQSQNTWEIGERIVVENIEQANKQALFALERGANALCFVLKKSFSNNDFFLLLKDIQLEWISTHFILEKSAWLNKAQEFSKTVKTKQQDFKLVSCSFQIEGNILSGGSEIACFQALNDANPNIQLITISTPPKFQKEEKIVEELSFLLQKANTYLKRMNDAGLDLNRYYSTIQFSFGLTDHYFLNIAKIRALKLLWQQVLSAWKVDAKADTIINIHLSKESQSEDEDYNKIKATTQAMSAVIGGITRLFVYPSDEFKTPNGTSFSRRIALNIQHLMQQESYLDRVQDPAAGSYFIENLTNDLAEKVWANFSEKA